MFFAGSFILDLAEFASTRGADRSSLLKMSSASEQQLAEPNSIVDYHAVSNVFGLIRQQWHTPNFGLEMGEEINLRSTQFIDQMMDRCSNVQEAFEFAIAYSRLISDSMECSLEVFGDRFKVNFELHPEWALLDDFAIAQNLDLALLCCQKSLGRLTRETHFPLEVNFYYPKPKKISGHFKSFNCHLNFGQPVSSIVFSKHLLQTPAVDTDHGLLAQLQEQANTMLESLPDEEPLLRRVKSSILKTAAPDNFNIASVASDLNVTTRTLQRQLKAQGLSFREVQQEIRLQLARKIMRNHPVNLDEVAYLVGYSEPSAFVRAFKAWTGQSPRKFVAAESDRY